MKDIKYTRFERARIIGARALQISMGAPILVKNTENNNNDPLTISMKEYEENIIPITTKKESK